MSSDLATVGMGKSAKNRDVLAKRFENSEASLTDALGAFGELRLPIDSLKAATAADDTGGAYNATVDLLNKDNAACISKMID